jgi:hypothetical protein
MKYLQIANGAVLALGLVMGLVLGVVCVLYLANLGSHPELRAELPALLQVTGLFLGLGLAGGAAFLGQRRGWPGRWLLQAVPLAPVAGLALFLASLRA